MSETRALAGAGVAHLALLAALSLGWTAITKPAPAPDAVAVDLLEIADTPKASAEAREATAPPPPPIETRPSAAPEPQPVQPVPTPPAPAPRVRAPEPSPPVADEPLPDAITQAPAPPPKPTPKPRHAKPAPNPDQLARSLDEALAPAPKPAKPRPANPSQLASLLDKALPTAPARPRVKPGPLQTAQPANAALSAQAMATLSQSIAGQIYPCWNVPPGSEGLTVDLHIRLAMDGTVAGPIEIRAQSGGANPAVARAFAESAKRAVSRCAPLKLPPELYLQWRDLDPLHFDPKDVK